MAAFCSTLTRLMVFYAYTSLPFYRSRTMFGLCQETLENFISFVTVEDFQQLRFTCQEAGELKKQRPPVTTPTSPVIEDSIPDPTTPIASSPNPGNSPRPAPPVSLSLTLSQQNCLVASSPAPSSSTEMPVPIPPDPIITPTEIYSPSPFAQRHYLDASSPAHAPMSSSTEYDAPAPPPELLTPTEEY